MALDSPSNWTAENVRLGTIEEKGRPSAKRMIQFSVMIFDSSDRMYLRTADVMEDGNVVLRTTGINNVVSARIVGVPVQL